MSDNIEDVKDVMKGNNVNMHACEKYSDVCDVCFNLQTGVKTLTDSRLYVVTVAVIVVDEAENDDDESSSLLSVQHKMLNSEWNLTHRANWWWFTREKM